jgi:small subunit ribosomal protein S8
MWSDPVADMLTRISNGLHAKRRQVKVPCSGVKIGLAKVLKQEGYIDDFDVIEDTKQGILRITLKYTANGEPIINAMRRESKPGRRVYKAVKDMPQVLNGLGVAILSTSMGVMSDRQCREAKVGGELICTVY